MIYVNGALVGILTGAAYSLVAVSITLMFRSTGVLSFAHAAFAAVGAYVYADLAGGGMQPVAAMFLALLVTVTYGLVIERLAIRPVRSASATTKLIVTLGVLSMTTGLLLQFYGFEPTSAPLLLPNRTVTIGDVAFSYQQIAIFVVAAVLAAALGWFLRATRFGLAVRAVAENGEAARLMGVPLVQVARFNWALGAFLAGLTGILVAPLSVITVATFPLLLTKALTATLFGGLVSLPLTLAGGLVVGVVESITTLKTSFSGSKELATLFLVIALLVLRRRWPAEATEETVFARRAPLRTIEPLMRRLSSGLERARPVLVAVAVPFAAYGLYLASTRNYWGFVGARGLFYVIEALSLVLLVGWGGQVSLMHGAYVGIGAFMTAYLVTEHGLPLPVAIIVAALTGMAMGAVAGLPALRLSGLQFGIASLAFAAAASEWLFKRPEFPKSLPRGELFGLDLFEDTTVFLVMLPVTVALYLLVWNVRRSTFGPLLISARDAGSTVAHFGANPKRTRMWAFMLASFIAALGGAFYGVLLSGFQPFDFSFFLSIALLLYVVVGGVQSLSGPLLAGFLFGIVPQLLQRGSSGTSASAIPDIVAGAVVVVLMAARPGGLAELLGRGGGEAPGGSRLRAGRFDLVVASHHRRPATDRSDAQGQRAPAAEDTEELVTR
ncbi:MAG: ABC transporter permease [Actinomycetota bacterium]